MSALSLSLSLYLLPSLSLFPSLTLYLSHPQNCTYSRPTTVDWGREKERERELRIKTGFDSKICDDFIAEKIVRKQKKASHVLKSS
jgi:hypothetical protein